MNLEIASRLVALRKENNLSQEGLAEKLGISRQAVSKWERAEASPDTDNLIALARLYRVSLDELLQIHEEEEYDTINGPEQGMLVKQEPFPGGSSEETICNEEQIGFKENDAEPGVGSAENAYEGEEDVHVGFDGIHVKDENAEVHVSWHGIHVYDKNKDEDVRIDKNGVRINGEKTSGHIFSRCASDEPPLALIAILVYIIIGVCFNLWHPGWLIFFLVPVVSTLIDAVYRRDPNHFAYPVLAVLIFLYAGLVHSIWHPAWVIFLTIPLYYSLANYICRCVKKEGREEDIADTE